MPLMMALVSPAGAIVPVVSVASLVFFAALRALGAKAGGATARVTFWFWRWRSPPSSGN
jgi:hypothetical protein